MGRSTGFARIQTVCFPDAAVGMPVLSDVLGLYARSGGKAWGDAGNLDGAAASGALPSVSTRGDRSRPVKGLMVKGLIRKELNGCCCKRRPTTAQKRNVDAGAASARISADGRGNVRHADVVQAARIAPAGEERSEGEGSESGRAGAGGSDASRSNHRGSCAGSAKRGGYSSVLVAELCDRYGSVPRVLQ